jgi:hypothetical protein
MTAHRKAARASDSPAHVSQNAPVSKSASANVWRLLEQQPGFNERVRRGKAQLDAGKRIPFTDDDK